MTGSLHELWISKVVGSEPPQFVLYAMPQGGTVRTLTTALLSREQALSALAGSERVGLRLHLEVMTSGLDQQIASDFEIAELAEIGLVAVKPSHS